MTFPVHHTHIHTHIYIYIYLYSMCIHTHTNTQHHFWTQGMALFWSSDLVPQCCRWGGHPVPSHASPARLALPGGWATFAWSSQPCRWQRCAWCHSRRAPGWSPHSQTHGDTEERIEYSEWQFQSIGDKMGPLSKCMFFYSLYQMFLLTPVHHKHFISRYSYASLFSFSSLKL